MKNATFIFVFSFLTLSFNSYSQIKISSTGKVGINNTNPFYQLDVTGSFRVSNTVSTGIVFNNGSLRPTVNDDCSLGDDGHKWTNVWAVNIMSENFPSNDSDERLKENIKNIEFTKGKLKELRPVRYRFKPVEKTDINGNIITKPASEEQIGLIAQEVRKIYPEIVVENKSGTLGIRYTELIPVLIKAFQEQQAEIDNLKSRIEKLESAK